MPNPNELLSDADLAEIQEVLTKQLEGCAVQIGVQDYGSRVVIAARREGEEEPQTLERLPADFQENRAKAVEEAAGALRKKLKMPAQDQRPA